MSSAQKTTVQNHPQQQAKTDFDILMDKKVTFVPFGEQEELHLTPKMVRDFLAPQTRSGVPASLVDCSKFMMLCKARQLNPWAGDAYITGYDTKDGPKFECITAMQALLKRAEANQHFDGIESGVIVQRKAVRTKDADGKVTQTEPGELVYRPGDFVMDNEELIGGWARCYRKDRSRPFYDALNRSTFDKKRSRWEADPAGMIVKCAEASVLRTAFPTQIGSLYIKEEMDSAHSTASAYANQDIAGEKVPTTLSELAERLQGTDEPDETSQLEPETEDDLAAEFAEEAAKNHPDLFEHSSHD